MERKDVSASRSMHLVLRVSATERSLDVIVAKHEDVIREYGAVWLGVRTCHLGERLKAKIAGQVLGSVPTFLYLIQRDGDSFVGYRGSIADATNHLQTGMAELTPAYYQELHPLSLFKAWIKISSVLLAPRAEIERLAMYTTGSQLISVLRKSMLSFGSVYLESKSFQTHRPQLPRRVMPF